MLVLSRRADEAVMIGNDITIRVVEVRGNKVRLAIEAPETVRVDREEIRRRVLHATAPMHLGDEPPILITS